MGYFEGITKKEFHSLLYKPEQVLAHVTEPERKETLVKHSKLCEEYLNKIIEKKQLDTVLENLERQWTQGMSEGGKKLYKEMLFHTIYLHDIGKINCNFQRKTMKNLDFKANIDINTTKHSMLSAIIYINEFYDELGHIQEKKERQILSTILLLNAYIITKHHGNFDSFEAFRKRIVEPDGEGNHLYTEQGDIYKESYRKEILKNKGASEIKKLFGSMEKCIIEWEKEEVSFSLHIYSRFVASLLLACDYYATTEFKNQKAVNDFGEISDVRKFYDIFKEGETYHNIRNYEKTEYGKEKSYENVRNINVLRNELFLEAERNLEENARGNIFYLEAPTGAGKSMVSFNLAFKMLESTKNLNKIFYVYPFNTLIEQNMDNLSKIFENSERMKDIAVINSLVPIKTVENKTMKKNFNNKEEESDSLNKDIDYVRSLLDRQFLHYPLILTTHISMFRFLFGTEKEDLFPLAQIANSVIIFDEIQSYKNSIWKEIITFLNHYSNLLNIKVIIMSATLPNLSKLIDTEVKTVNLIHDRDKYFKSPIFKNRVKLDFSLLDIKESVVEKVIEHVRESASKENINILMEFIRRESAEEVYQRLCDLNLLGKEVMLLTGETSVHERKKIITAFKERKNIILVATQVVEAGVDLDADIGYKDVSLLDSEEQFIGRINRHFQKREGIVYFFNLDSAEGIYKGDVRKEMIYTLLNEENRNILINKDFEIYYEKILKYLEGKAKSADGFLNFKREMVNKFDFLGIESRMDLIGAEREYSVFFSRVITLSDTETLDGEEVWNNYVTLLGDIDMDYAQKRVKLQEASTKLNYFIYRTRVAGFPYEKHIGDLYYLSNVDEYFENGRFIRKKFEKNFLI